MWDEQDYTARWVQGICAIPLLAFAALLGYLIANDLDSGYGGYSTAGEASLFCPALYVGARCAWYAITGRDNINRDDY